MWNTVGLVGHSVGGYVGLGLAGGWDDWRIAHVGAVLLFSPYSMPFSVRDTLRAVRAPVMYQGAELDLGITPFLDGRNGAYARSNAPKHFVKLRAGNHLEANPALSRYEYER